MVIHTETLLTVVIIPIACVPLGHAHVFTFPFFITEDDRCLNMEKIGISVKNVI
jgi:hypothetical protein